MLVIGVPKPWVLVHLWSIRVISTVDSIEVGIFHFTHGPKHDMDAYIRTLFGGKARDLCWMLDPTHNISPSIFCIRQSRSYKNHTSVGLKNWDFPSIMELRTPCELTLRCITLCVPKSQLTSLMLPHPCNKTWYGGTLM